MRKSTRRIVAIVMAVAMILTSMATAVFADNTTGSTSTANTGSTYADSANILQGYGVFVGDNGNLMLDQQLKRQDSVVIALRLMGKKDAEFENYETQSDFTDITDPYYLPIIGMAQDLGLVEGMGDGTFGFDQLVTAQQLETILLRSLGYTVTDEEYANVPQLAQQVGIANLTSVDGKTEITRDIVAQMMLNTLNTNVKDGNEKLGVQLGFMKGDEKPPVSALEISSAAANTDSSVKVTFNRPVEDTSKISFTLTGSVAVQTTATWNDAKTEATLTAPSTLLDGTYTVKAAGDNFTAGKDSATFVVAKNGVGKIEFTSDKLVKDASNNAVATLRYKISDNYGVDITKNTLSSDLTVAASKSISSFNLDADNGIMTITFAGAFADTDKTVAVTIIGTKSGVAGTATLNVADAAKIDSITMNAVTFPKTTPATTKIVTGKAVAAYIPVDLKDQYGNVINTKAQFDADVLPVISDSSVVLTSEEYTPDNSTAKAVRLDVDTTGLSVAKSVNVTLVSKLSGKSASMNLDIVKPAVADKVSIGSQTQIVAANDAVNTLVIPITVVDQFGAQLSQDDIVANMGNINVTGTGALAGKIGIATSGDNRGKIVNTAQLGATVGTAVITVSTPTSVATTTIDVKDAAYEKTIQVNTTPAANLLMGATTKMDYKFIDQYGRAIKAPAATKVTFEVSNASIINATDGTVTANANATPVVSNAGLLAQDKQLVISTNGTEGNAKVTAKLYDQAGTSVISSVDTNFAVTSGVPSTLTFNIADIAAMPVAVADRAVDGTDAYARAIVITATDANGATYAIPANRIMSVTTTDSTPLVKISAAPVSGAAVTAQEGNYVVAPLASATVFTANDTVTTKTATIKAVISTDNGPKEVTKTVTISKDAPKATSIVFADKALKAGNPYALDSDAKTITGMTGTTAALNGSALYVYEVDQYGVYTAVAPAALTATNVDRFSGVLGYASNALVFNANQIKANQDVYVMYQAADGVYGTFTLRATDGTLN